MAAKKSEPLTLARMLHKSLRDHGGRNERRYVREGSSDSELRGAIVDELAALAEATVKHKDTQRQKAMKPRGAGDDGRTTSRLVADVVKGQPVDMKPGDLVPHVHSAMDANGKEPITDKWARELIRRALSTKKRRT